MVTYKSSLDVMARDRTTQIVFLIHYVSLSLLTGVSFGCILVSI